MVPALHQDLGPSQTQRFLDFRGQLLPAQHIGFAMAGRPEKSAKTAPAHADVRIVDVAVNDVGDYRFGMLFQSRAMGHGPKRMKIRATV